MTHTPDPSPPGSPGTPWMPNRPGAPSDGPPGLAPLLDAERSVLRDHHERLRALAEAEQAQTLRVLALDDAVKLQNDARRQTRGMRDRLRARELDRRILTADARHEAAAAAAAVDAATVRVRVTEQRLREIRSLVDAQAAGAESAVEAIRREATLPATAVVYPTIAAFVAEAPSRAVGDPRQQDLVGKPFGDRWHLEERGRPWLVTVWRALWSGSDPGGNR
ncbi:MAG: hypothetical protein JHD16_06155, partial [Solirubrobacteraceae bacterium]|nr:hypothetical protein [Solirubrobacteraceae bacterium]